MPDQDIAGNISRRGYLPIWTIEALRGVEWQGQFTCRPKIMDGVDRTEAEVYRKIVYIQVESLDYDMVGCAVGQKLVMPFLTRMASEGALFKIYGQKIAFSSNSDYEFLCTRVAKPPYIAYKKINSYNDSIPYLLKKSGHDVKFFHGWNSSFQEVAYRLMGGETFFPNDMEQDGYGVSSSLTMPHVTDADVFKYAITKIEDGRDAFFHVIITMTMHDPVKYMYDEVFLGGDYPIFFSTANKTDCAIEDYVKKLPENTLVIVVGDHIPHHGLKSGFTPAIVYSTGKEQPVMKKFTSPYTRCEFSTYLRTLLHLPAVEGGIPISD